MTAPASTPGTAVAVPEKNRVVALLRSEEAQRRIVPLLGHGASYDQVMAEVWLAVQTNPKIMECAPVDIVMSTARAVATGGRIGRDVYLVPFKGKLAVVEDYKFLAKMIVQAGGARAVTPGVVYEGDEFEWELGTNCFIRHKPSGEDRKNRKITHAYAFAKVRFGESVIVVLDRSEIEKIRRDHSKQWKDGPLEAIPWYGPKSCIRRLAKVLPDNPRLAAALRKLGLDTDDVDGDELPEIPEAEVTPFHGHAKELAPLAENWSRSRPLANQADGFGYGGADETPLAPEAIQAMRDEPDPFTGEQTTDGELPLGEPPVRAVRRSAQGEGR